MNNIQDEIDLVGESAASIDAYAATDPAECFAVLSEYFSARRTLFCSHVSRHYGAFLPVYLEDPSQRLRVSAAGATTAGIEH